MVYSEQPVFKAIMKKLKKHQSVETEEGCPDISFAQMKKVDMIKKGLCFCCGEKGRQQPRLRYVPSPSSPSSNRP
jgi:hypothetical protein